MITYAVWCPNCDYKLWIEEQGHNYVLIDNGHAVHNCPNCLTPLIVVDGELKEDKP